MPIVHATGGFVKRCIALFTIVLAMAVSTTAFTQDKADKKVKGTLPAGWKGLDLSTEQKGKIYSIQTEYKGKISKLEDEIKSLKTMEKADMVKVLNDDQRKKLAAIAVGETVEQKKADDKKPDVKK
jgi:hypothetical protein